MTKQRKNVIVVSGVVFIALALITVLYFQREKEPIKVGFIGNLTGGLSNWGVEPRNGMLLAFETVNEAGGIDGHAIEVITKDDQQDPELAAQAVRELVNEGVVVIIGPTISSTAMGAVPAANELQMLLIGPTVSTEKLSAKDDFFLRIATVNSWMAYDLAAYLYEKKEWRTVAPAFETSNRAYSEDIYHNFKKFFEELGGSVLPVLAFEPGSGYADIAEKLIAHSADGIFLVAGDIDTAYICQEIRKQGSAIPIAESGLAISENLIHHGGLAVEGIVSPQTAFRDPKDKKYQPFLDLYTKRYGEEPSHAESFGYDAANMLVEALRQSKEWTPVSLKETILRIKRFDGPAGIFELDAYGDVRRKAIMVTVKNGQFAAAQ